MHAGQIIKLIRTVDGLPQGTLAHKLNVTGAYLSQVENGKRQPSLSFLRQFSQKFSVPLPLLLLSDQTDEAYNEIFVQLREILARLLAARASQLQTQRQFELWEYSDKEKD